MAGPAQSMSNAELKSTSFEICKLAAQRGSRRPRAMCWKLAEQSGVTTSWTATSSTDYGPVLMIALAPKVTEVAASIAVPEDPGRERDRRNRQMARTALFTRLSQPRCVCTATFGHTNKANKGPPIGRGK